MPTLTLAMIVKNESKHLDACLQSVADLVNEIIIVDSGSTDDTAEIAARYGAKFYVHADWQGFGKQRQIAQQYATGDYLLWLDADERLTAELRTEIMRAVQQNQINMAYEINRLSHVFGREIRHSGWYPDYVLRLYPRHLGAYSDAAVHESVQIADGVRVEKLSGNALHYTYDDVRQYLIKSASYADLWAQQNALRKQGSLLSGSLHGIWKFLQMYIFKFGFLDGKQGFLLAVLSAASVFNKYATLWVRQQKTRD